MSKKVTQTKDSRKTFLMQDSIIEYPELWMEVYIAGDASEEKAFAQMFVKAACTRADHPDEADVVVFTGGPDVNPALYGKQPHKLTKWSDKRDAEDIKLWNYCVDNGIPMIGVCRGMQFGHVMMGGELYQDVDSHYGDHQIWDNLDRYMIPRVSSVHHQMVRPGVKGMEVIADAYVAEEKWIDDETIATSKGYDVEAIFYRDVCFFGVQGHPEYRGYSRYAKWFLDKVNHLIIENPDIALINHVRRIKPELRVSNGADKVLKELV